MEDVAQVWLMRFIYLLLIRHDTAVCDFIFFLFVPHDQHFFFCDMEMYGRGVTLHVHLVPLLTVLHIILN